MTRAVARDNGTGKGNSTSEPVALPLSAPSALWMPSAVPFTPSCGFVASSNT